jgi:hypothetical protein
MKKRLVLIVLSLHLAIVLLCFGLAIINPERYGFAIINVFIIDAPVTALGVLILRIIHYISVFAHQISALPHSTLAPFGTWLIYFLYFSIMGSLWWYLLVDIIYDFIAWLRDQS